MRPADLWSVLLFEDYLDQCGRELTDQQRRQQCDEAREDIPGLTC
jgi:hypothetical protein